MISKEEVVGGGEGRRLKLSLWRGQSMDGGARKRHLGHESNIVVTNDAIVSRDTDDPAGAAHILSEDRVHWVGAGRLLTSRYRPCRLHWGS